MLKLYIFLILKFLSIKEAKYFVYIILKYRKNNYSTNFIISCLL